MTRDDHEYHYSNARLISFLMIITFFLLLGLLVNSWLSWILGSWAGLTAFLVSIPVIAFVMVGGGVAI